MGNPFDEIKRQGGLWTHGNPLNAPDGAMLVADEAEILREDMVTRRRGYTGMSSNLPAFRPEQLISIGGQLYLSLDSGLWYWDGTSWLRKTGAINGGMRINAMLLTSNRLYVSNYLTLSYFDLATGKLNFVAGQYGVSGSTDGTGTAARFANVYGLASDGVNTIYVADNNAVRTVTISTGIVTTIAGVMGTPGITNGTGTAAKFNYTSSIDSAVIVYSGGNAYVADYTNHAVRQVTPGGVVTTFAGLIGTPGATNGTGGAARFNFPNSIADVTGTLAVSDLGNSKFRSVTVSSALVSDLATTIQARDISTDGAFIYFKDIAAGNSIASVTVAGTSPTSLAGNNVVGAGHFDGFGTAAQFNNIAGTAAHSSAPKQPLILDSLNPGGSFSTEIICRLYVDPNKYVATEFGGATSIVNYPTFMDGVLVGPT